MCRLHDHLPSPFVPRDCPDCHPEPAGSSEGIPSGGLVGTTAATAQLLSDIADALRDRLRRAEESNRQLTAQATRLEAEVTGLKRGLSSTKRDLRAARERLADAAVPRVTSHRQAERVSTAELLSGLPLTDDTARTLIRGLLGTEVAEGRLGNLLAGRLVTWLDRWDMPGRMDLTGGMAFTHHSGALS